MLPAFIVKRVLLTDNSTCGWETKQEQKSHQSTSPAR